MLAVVRAIHHAADQFHVALLFRFDRPCHERQRGLRATLTCSGLRRASTAHLYVYGARGGGIRDATLRPSEDRQVPAQCSGPAGKVPETGKGTNRTEGRKRDPPQVLDRATPTQLVSAHGFDLSPTRPLGDFRMTCPRCQQENLPTMKFCGECGTPLQRPQGGAQPAPSYADVQRSLTEALEQQTATGEILRIISSSPSDIKPVLDAVARSAMRLCESYDAMIMLREGEELHFPVHHGPIRQTAQLTRRAISRGWVAGRAVLDRQPVHVHDLVTAGAEFPMGQADAVRAGYRTTLSVPLLREGEAIGVIHLRRREVRPFTDNQIALLQTFADQAVIAIENVRLFTELEARNRDLTEALDQQTATSEVLRVISSALTDVQPVFRAILERATRLCGADLG